MINLLADSGFGKIQDADTKKETFIRINGNVVTEVTSKRHSIYRRQNGEHGCTQSRT